MRRGRTFGKRLTVMLLVFAIFAITGIAQQKRNCCSSFRGGILQGALSR